MSLNPRHASSDAIVVGDFEDRARGRGVFGAAVFFVVAGGHVLLPQWVDTSTRSGWLLANSVWLLAILAAAALAFDIVRQNRRQVVLEVNASGVVLRTGTDPASTQDWTALDGVILTVGHRASPTSRRHQLRLILIPRGGAGAVVDPHFARWQGCYGAHASDLGIPVLFYAHRDALDAALRQFAGPLYRGVVDVGTTWSLSRF